jgi:tetratricopeptide (TPR) repeat protein
MAATGMGEARGPSGARRLCSAVAGALLLTSVTPVVRAAGTGAGDAAHAKKLFADGRAALEAGRLEEACRKFDESHRIDPRVGTLLNLGECLERRALLADALALFNRAVGLARVQGDERIEYARGRAGKLVPRIPLLTLRLAPGASAATTLELRSADDPYAPERRPELGRPLSLNPGAYLLRVTAPGATTRSLPIALAEGDRREIEVAAGPPPVEVASSDTTLVTAGFVTGGAGLAAAAVGAVLGALALDRQSDARPGCNADNECSQHALELQDEGIAFGNASTVAFVVGGAALAAGVVLLAVGYSSSGEGPRTALGIGPTGGSLAHTW